METIELKRTAGSPLQMKYAAKKSKAEYIARQKVGEVYLNRDLTITKELPEAMTKKKKKKKKAKTTKVCGFHIPTSLPRFDAIGVDLYDDGFDFVVKFKTR